MDLLNQIVNHQYIPMNMSLHNQNQIADQHIYLERRELIEIEKRIRIQRHVERYALLRQFVRGIVCDAACGCGYGSYLLSTNPDVDNVIGLDLCSDIIDFASKEYGGEKTQFFQADVSDWVSFKKIDMLVSVETIEHISDKHTLLRFCNRNSINNVILTYPSKKTTHYNPFHIYDFKLQDILDIFSDFTCYRHFNWEYEFDVVFLMRNH